jgi:hypothetical protein
MDLKDILSISGKGELYKFISQGRNGIIVESLVDKKRMNAHASLKISSLEETAIFTDDKEVPLVDVFKSIFDKEGGKKAIDAKSADPEALKKYMAEVLPNYDREKVYVSDIKKLINWYNQLQELKMLNFDEPEDGSKKEEHKSANPVTSGAKSGIKGLDKKDASKTKVSAKAATSKSKAGGKPVMQRKSS